MGVHILGVGQFGFGTYPQLDPGSIAVRAVNRALVDAGLGPRDMQALFFASTDLQPTPSQPSLWGQIVARTAGVDGASVVNVGNGALGGSTALHLAWSCLRAHTCDVALVVGADQVCPPPREPDASHPADGEPVAQGWHRLCRDWVARDASLATWHMETFGTTREHLASVAAKNRSHASLNPRALRRHPITPSEALAGPATAPPLTEPMCTFPVDGAVALVVCSGQFLRKLASPKNVQLVASVLGRGTSPRTSTDSGSTLAKKAYAAAGTQPQDIDLAELHDTTAFTEILATEAVGFCDAGHGGPFALSGATSLGGQLPVNTSGGLECCGMAPGAVGLSQVHEVVTQLRGEAVGRQVDGARLGLTQNTGGEAGREEGAACIHILEAPGC